MQLSHLLCYFTSPENCTTDDTALHIDQPCSRYLTCILIVYTSCMV
jgi:hypothetical protein